jgi:pyruvate dehydrogenase E2 component (dihydrolipoamide acetyltransferase)
MPNIIYRKPQHLTSYRRVAIASWRHPRDPSTYTTLELPTDSILETLANIEHDPKPTLTHYITRVVALTLSEKTALNHVLRFGRLYERKHSSVFISTLVRSPKGKDLSGFLIPEANTKSICKIATECQQKTRALRDGSDGQLGANQALLAKLPVFVIRPLLAIMDTLQVALNISFKRFGIPDDPFGSVMLTNIGALGIDNALVPISPYTRCPLIMSVGKPCDTPVAENGEVVVRKCVKIGFTFDHRYADGGHGALFLRRFQKHFLNPEAMCCKQNASAA